MFALLHKLLGESKHDLIRERDDLIASRNFWAESCDTHRNAWNKAIDRGDKVDRENAILVEANNNLVGNWSLDRVALAACRKKLDETKENEEKMEAVAYRLTKQIEDITDDKAQLIKSVDELIGRIAEFQLREEGNIAELQQRAEKINDLELDNSRLNACSLHQARTIGRLEDDAKALRRHDGLFLHLNASEKDLIADALGESNEEWVRFGTRSHVHGSKELADRNIKSNTALIERIKKLESTP